MKTSFKVVLLLLALPAAVEAQFTFTTNNGAITITGYTGPGGAVTIPSSTNGLPVTGIGEWAFYATTVTNVLIPDSVTNIGDGAFFDCGFLTNVTIGVSVTSIGDWTFAFCSSLTSVCFRGNAPSLGGVNAFYGNLATVYYLPGTTNWGPTFDGHPAVLWNPPVPYTYTTNNGAITITGYTGSGGGVSIPGTINFLPVSSVGNFAFNSNTKLTTVAIPNSVTSIGNYTFSRCTNLTSLTIGNGVTSIGQGAFYTCTSLTNITIPNSVTNIGLEAFAGCTSLTSVTLGNRVTDLASGVFYGCTSLTSITIPNSVTYIGGTAISGGPAAFQGCISLTNITIGTNVTFIGSDAFSGCTSLTSVTIPNSVTNIGLQAFAGCSNLMAITVETNNIFYSSVAGVLFDKGQWTLIQYPLGNGFRYYVIPNSVTNIGYYAFANDTSLAGVTIPDSVTSIGQHAFSSCISLTSVTIGTNVTSIEQGAFNGCPNLTSATIPDSVISIGNWAFSACTSLTNVTIGNGVTSIGYGAIDLCPRLTSIYFTGNAPSLSSSIMYAGPFYGDTATIYYLPGTTGWSTPFGGLQAVLWLPQAQASDANFGIRSNQFGFNINWASGMAIVVEACTDLANPIWSPVATNTLSGGSSYFSDPQWTNYARRFYRLRSP